MSDTKNADNNDSAQYPLFFMIEEDNEYKGKGSPSINDINNFSASEAIGFMVFILLILAVAAYLMSSLTNPVDEQDTASLTKTQYSQTFLCV